MINKKNRNLIIFSVRIFLRRIIYRFLFLVDNIFLKRKYSTIIILCYHSISNDDWLFGVSPGDFKKQILYLKENYSFISLNDLEKYLDGNKTINKQNIILTFDDGYKDIFTMKDFLNSLSIKPALFILSEPEKADRKVLKTEKPFLSKEEIIQLKKDGWDIASHTATHTNLLKLDPEKLYKEIVDSKNVLEKELGIKINYFTYPNGKYSQEILSLVKKAGYKLGFSMDDDDIKRDTDRFLLPRIGIIRWHNINDFKATISPSVIKFRKLLKKTFIQQYL